MTAMERRIPPHLHAKRELTCRAAELQGPDGSLPPERELCEMIGVSRSTLRKAMDELACESFIVNIPRKGNFLTGASPRRQVAIAIDGCNIPYTVTMSGILDALSEKPYWVNIQTIRDFSDTHSIIRNFGLSGLIWLSPANEKLPAIAELMASQEVPTSVAIPFADEDKEFALKDCYATMDKAATGALRAEFMLKRGHRAIAYAGRSKENPTFDKFIETISSAGISNDSSFSLGNGADLPERLNALLNEGKATALVSDGGNQHLERLFKTLNTHPKGHILEIEVPEVVELQELRKRYPRVKIVARTIIPYREIGHSAAEMLIKMIEGGQRTAPHHIAPEVREEKP